jgi:triacylglycerol lipase
MAAELSPVQACEVAESTYALRLSSDMRFAEAAVPTVRGLFDVAGGNRLTGATGVGVTQTSGFGYLAWGKGSRDGECLVGVRGTYAPSVADWLTNLRIAGTRGPSGYIVHEGFWKAAQTILPQVESVLRSRNPSAVHVVGHSLGGAIATLMADVLSGYGVDVKLYTFGAPRSGLEGHVRYLSQRLGPANIFRAWHSTDPVPMVPIFPYIHVPAGSNGYEMKGPGTLVAIAAHLLPSYKRSVGTAAWTSLPLLSPPLGSFSEAQAWLAEAARNNSAIVMGSAAVLRALLSALQWILDAAGRSFGIDVFVGATIIDVLARLLYAGATQSLKLAETVEHLMAVALRFTGRTIAAGTTITAAFIGYVIELLFRAITTPVARAIAALS